MGGENIIENFNKLISRIGSCHLADVTSLRCLYNESNIYDYEGITIVCGEIYKETPEYVRFTLGFPLELLGIAPHGESNIFTATTVCVYSWVILKISASKTGTTPARKNMREEYLFINRSKQCRRP